MKVKVPPQIITTLILGGAVGISYIFWADVIFLARAFGEWLAKQ